MSLKLGWHCAANMAAQAACRTVRGLPYGKHRDFDPKEARAAYAKVYNAQSVLPCSQMPRLGYHKFLSEQQMKDVIAYLFAKDSPVNK